MSGALLALALLAGADPGASLPVATANGRPITLGEVSERLARTRAAGGQGVPTAVLEDLVRESLLADEGVRAGLRDDPEVKAAARAAERRAAAALLVEREIDSLPPPRDERLREIFHGMADSVTYSAIFLATEAEAHKVLERLGQGARFEDEARASLDREGKDGTGKRTRSRAQLEPALARVLFDAPPGKPAGPVALELGFAVVVVHERNLGDEGELERRKPELLRFVQAQQRAQARTHYLAQLRKQAKVSVDEGFLQGTGTRLDASREERERVLADAGGEPVRYGEVLDRMQRLARGRSGGHFSGPTVKAELAWAIVDERLLENAAMARGLGRDPAARAARDRAEREAVVRLAAARVREAVPPPTDAELLERYRAHPEDATRPGRRRCLHILVAEEGVAKELRARLRRGEDWDEAAERYSLDAATAARGGLVGTLDDRQLDALARAGEGPLAAAFRSTAPGAVSEPVHSRAGWHLVKVSDPEPPALEPFEAVKAGLSTRLRAERQDAAVRARLDALRARARVEIDERALRQLEAT